MSDFTYENVNIKLPVNGGLLPDLPPGDWASQGGVADVEHMLCKDNSMVFGPGYDQIVGAGMNALPAGTGTPERFVPLEYSTSYVGILITTTSLFYITPTGFADITSSGLNVDNNCRGIFTHTSGYVSSAIGESAGAPKVWFTNGVDPIYVWDGTTLTSTLTSEFPAGTRPHQVSYKDNRLFLCSIGTEYNKLMWSEINDPTTVEVTSYLYIQGGFDTPATALISFNKFFILMYPDKIKIGQQTQLYDLPYVFEDFAVQNLGLTQQRGWCVFGNYLYFMCNYRLYRLGTNLQAEQVVHFLNRDMVKNLGKDVFLAADEDLQQVYIGASTATTFIYAYNPYMDKWGKLSFGSAIQPLCMGALELASTNYSTMCIVWGDKIYKLGYGSGFTYPATSFTTGPLTMSLPEESKTINEVGLHLRSNQTITNLAGSVIQILPSAATSTLGTLTFTTANTIFSALEKVSTISLETQYVVKFYFSTAQLAVADAVKDMIQVEGIYLRVQQRNLNTP